VEDSVINVDPQNIIIKTAKKKRMILPTVFTVGRKDISQENALITRRDCTEKEVHALAVGQSDIL
jgi:hypothetical protein